LILVGPWDFSWRGAHGAGAMGSSFKEVQRKLEMSLEELVDEHKPRHSRRQQREKPERSRSPRREWQAQAPPPPPGSFFAAPSGPPAPVGWWPRGPPQGYRGPMPEFHGRPPYNARPFAPGFEALPQGPPPRSDPRGFLLGAPPFYVPGPPAPHVQRYPYSEPERPRGLLTPRPGPGDWRGAAPFTSRLAVHGHPAPRHAHHEFEPGPEVPPRASGSWRRPAGIFQIRLCNVPPELTARDIAEAFGEVSQQRVESVDLLRDSRGKALEEAVILFNNPDDAQNAVRRYNGGDLNGRRLQAFYEGETSVPQR